MEEKELKESHGFCGKADIFGEVAKKIVLPNIQRTEEIMPPFHEDH